MVAVICNFTLFLIEEQLLRRNVKQFRGGLVFKAHRLVYLSTLGWRVIKKKKKKSPLAPQPPAAAGQHAIDTR